jgi:serine/threonine protein kinase
MREFSLLYKDLKMSHVLVDAKTLEVSLIDFGMAEIMDEFGTTSIPGGTYHCMSPEMADLYWKKLKNEEADYSNLPGYSSDYWTIGILALEFASKFKTKPFPHFRPEIHTKEGYL